MLRHTVFVNSISLALGPLANESLKLQEHFEKALETVAALKPAYKTRKYNNVELRCLIAPCSLTEAELVTSLPFFHKKLMSEGHTKRGTDAVLTQELHPYKKSEYSGLIYVSPEMVTDIKHCRYGLGLDASYKNCHRGLRPFTVPHMSLFHQQ